MHNFLIEIPRQQYYLEQWIDGLTSLEIYTSPSSLLWMSFIPGVLFGGLSWTYYKSLKGSHSRIYSLSRLSIWLWGGLSSILRVYIHLLLLGGLDTGLFVLLVVFLGWLLGRRLKLLSERVGLITSIVAFMFLLLQQVFFW